MHHQPCACCTSGNFSPRLPLPTRRKSFELTYFVVFDDARQLSNLKHTVLFTNSKVIKHILGGGALAHQHQKFCQRVLFGVFQIYLKTRNPTDKVTYASLQSSGAYNTFAKHCTARFFFLTMFCLKKKRLLSADSCAREYGSRRSVDMRERALSVALNVHPLEPAAFVGTAHNY